MILSLRVFLLKIPQNTVREEEKKKTNFLSIEV